MLGRRRRRRANLKPALGQCIVFAALSPDGPQRNLLGMTRHLFSKQLTFVDLPQHRCFPEILKTSSYTCFKQMTLQVHWAQH